MSIWSELYSTERIVRDAESAFDLTHSLSKSYRAETSAQPFVFQARSSLRERALNQALGRLRDPTLSQGALELYRSGDLSPAERQMLAGRLALREGAEKRLWQQINQIRAQDAAADADERAFAKMSPLQQSRTRDGWYRRSVSDRNAAVAGPLQRERRNLAPLTREAVGRAKAIAAARGMSDPYVVTQSDVETRDLANPCIEYQLTQQRRRETFFARGLVIRGGYPGQRGSSRSPC